MVPGTVLRTLPVESLVLRYVIVRLKIFSMCLI